METTAQIREFLAEHISEPIADDDDIFGRGLVNSLFVVQLVSYVEDTFEVRVDGEDLNFDNFRSINAIADLVNRLMGRSVTATTSG